MSQLISFTGISLSAQSFKIKTYSLVLGAIPALVAVAGFIVLILRPLTSRAVRRRVIIIAFSFICLVGAWTIMPSGQEAVVVASRILALLGALSAYLAYYPPTLLTGLGRRLHLEEDDQAGPGRA